MMYLDLLGLNRAVLQQRAHFRLCVVQTLKFLAAVLCWIWRLNSRWSQKDKDDGADSSRRRRRKMAWRANAVIIWCCVWLMSRRYSDLSQSDDGLTPNKHTHTHSYRHVHPALRLQTALHPWSPRCVHVKTVVSLVYLQQRSSIHGCFTRFQCGLEEVSV